jgi:hypothetical protein
VKLKTRDLAIRVNRVVNILILRVSFNTIVLEPHGHIGTIQSCTISPPPPVWIPTIVSYYRFKFGVVKKVEMPQDIRNFFGGRSSQAAESTPPQKTAEKNKNEVIRPPSPQHRRSFDRSFSAFPSCQFLPVLRASTCVSCAGTSLGLNHPWPRSRSKNSSLLAHFPVFDFTTPPYLAFQHPFTSEEQY